MSAFDSCTNLNNKILLSINKKNGDIIDQMPIHAMKDKLTKFGKLAQMNPQEFEMRYNTEP